jgi:uncharacterized protein (DUF1697 family)
MANANLRRIAEGCGLGNVSTVISSGNLVFESESSDIAGMEAMLERAWPEELGFESTTIIRSQADLEDLVASRPFGEREHGAGSYLLVTFSKLPLAEVGDAELDADAPYELVGATERELFTVTDMTADRPPNVMAWIEARFGKAVSSRTWLTVGRILRRMG